MKILKVLILGILTIGLLIGAFIYKPREAEQRVVPNNVVETQKTPMFEVAQSSDVWSTIQEWRSIDHEPYILDQGLCDFVEIRLEELQARGELDEHNGFYPLAKEIHSSLGTYVVSENTIAYDQVEYAKDHLTILNGWLNSESHRKALEDGKYTHSCVECDNRFCIQIFAGY